MYFNFAELAREHKGSGEQIQVAPYTGRKQHVRRTAEYLQNTIADSLVGAYVHGSLGTGDEIAYSDFDGLVILKDDVLRSPEQLARTARNLGLARSVMFAMDPLQHHGWFVLTEADLGYHCEAHFPRELFRHARALLPAQGATLRVSVRGWGREPVDTFQAVAGSLRTSLAMGVILRDLYVLKNTVSLFILLPALYL